MTSPEKRYITCPACRIGWKDARGGRPFGARSAARGRKRQTERCVERGAARRNATL